MSDLMRYNAMTRIYLFGWIKCNALGNLNSGDSGASGVRRIESRVVLLWACSHFFEEFLADL